MNATPRAADFAARMREQHLTLVGRPASVDSRMAVAGLLMVGTDQAFITDAFEYALGRPAQPDDITLHLSRLESGLSRIDFLDSLLASDEATARREAAPTTLAPSLSLTILAGGMDVVPERAEFLVRAYATILGRSPDRAGFLHAYRRLHNGATFRAIVREMALSPEALTPGGGRLSRWRASLRLRQLTRQLLDTPALQAQMIRTVIVGGGGHARVCLDLLRANHEIDVVGYTAPSPAKIDVGVPYLGTDAVLPTLRDSGVRAAFAAVGDNRLRLARFRQLQAQGFEMVNAISPHAVVSDGAQLGRGIALMGGVIVNTGAHIGDATVVNTGATVDHDCNIGAGCHVAPGVHLAGNVTLDTGAMFGVGSAAIPGVRVGQWTTVGAGSTVIQDVEADVVVVGSPAQNISLAGANSAV